MNSVVIGMGSNIEPDKNIPLALKKLAEHFRIKRESRFVETDPIGTKTKEKFLNGAVLIETELDQEAIDQYLKQIEGELGRIRTADKFAPREIDLDVIVFNGIIVDDDFYCRDFLKQNVQDVLPNVEINKGG